MNVNVFPTCLARRLWSNVETWAFIHTHLYGDETMATRVRSQEVTVVASKSEKTKKSLGKCRQIRLLASVFAFSAQAGLAADLTVLSLDDLLGLPIVGAAKYAQKQSEVAAAVSVITRQEIQLFGWRSLAEALGSLPGVYTTYDRQYTFLGARGLGLPGDWTSRVLVTINGMRINDPVYDGGAVGLEFPLDMDLIERIEFIPGPGGAVYGQNAMFGVVNVITRRGSDLDGSELTLAYQHPQATRSGRISYGKKLDNDADLLVSLSGLNSRGEDRWFEFGSTGLTGVATGMDQAQDKKLYARLASGVWALELVHGDARKDDPTAAYFSDPLVPGQFNRDRFTLAQAQYQDSFAANTLHVDGRVFLGAYRYSSSFSYAGAPVLSTATGDWRGTEWRLLSTALPGHKLMLGFEAQSNLRTDQAVFDPANPANDIHIPGSGNRLGVFAQDEWRASDVFTATLGLRLDRNHATGTQVSPRAALIWQVTPATVLKALAGRAHRAPNTYEKNYADGVSQTNNAQLSGESADTLEWVLDHRLARDLTMRASVYRWTMDDLITLGEDPVSGLTQYQSGLPIEARGLELSADKTWDSGARLRGSLAWQNIAHADGTALLNSPKLLAKLNYSRSLGLAGLRLGYEMHYSSERLSLDGSRQGGYSLSNLNLGTQALGKGLEVSMGIYNLFDKSYTHPASDTNWQNALAQDGRSVRLKLDYSF